jgi:hypothetical protein
MMAMREGGAESVLCTASFQDIGISVFQIIFNELSAAEISQLDTVLQLELLTEFKGVAGRPATGGMASDSENWSARARRSNRYRAKGYRIYFEVVDGGVVRVHRVLHKNSLEDFLFRNGSKVAGHEDDILARSKASGKLIEEGTAGEKGVIEGDG